MPVAPAYELSVPAPHNAFFTAGEKAVSCAATISGGAARTNYYLSKWFDLEGGEYVIRAYAVQASSWSTTFMFGNSRVFFFTPRDKSPDFATISLPRGRQRIDVLVSNLKTIAGGAYIAFSLWRQGKLVYASDSDGWVFDTAPIADAAVPDPGDARLRLPVFAVAPNWADGIMERIAYSTEILSSEADTEQRRSLRINPKRSFELSFARHGVMRSRVDTMIAGMGRNKLLLPMWHDQFVLESTLGATVFINDGSISMREFVEGGLAVVTINNPAVFEILQIDSINYGTGLITFVDAPTDTWPAGARLVPLRVARVVESGALDNLTDSAGTVQVRFEIDSAEPTWFTGSWGYCSPVWRFAFDRRQAISVTHTRPTAFEIDNAYGPVDVFDLDQITRLNVRGALTFFGRKKAFAYRQFIDAARGKASRFWMPTFTSDVQAVSNLGGTTLNIRSIGYADYVTTDQEYRSKITLEFSDGRAPVYANVLNVQRVSDTVEAITLEQGLPSATAAQIARISFMMPVRFDQDLFELQHLVDGQAAVRTSAVFRTVDLKGMPPIDCALTTPLYPIELIEGFSPTFAITGGYLLGAGATDGMENTFAVTGGSLDNPTLYTQTPVDGLEKTFVITGGSLEVTVFFATTDAPPDGIEPTFTITNGQMVLSVIQYDRPLDGLDVTFSITGGSLS